jgi:hypothetical protein
MTILNSRAQVDPLLALADTNTDKIPAQISKTHRYALPGRNICCFMGYESETIISKKTQVMKNQHVLLKIKETKYCSVHCHALEPNNFMTILNSKAQGDPILAEHIATM